MKDLFLVPPLLALAVPAAAQTHWTVDDDGPADFADVAAAVAAVGAGDVLLIEPGNYGPVTLTKRLSLLGDPSGERPHLASLTVDGPPGFDLAHLALGATVVRNALGHARVDDCEIVGNLGLRALQVRDSGPLLLQRSLVTGPFLHTDGVVAVTVEGASVVALVDSQIIGGDAGKEAPFFVAGWGGHGLEVGDTSAVLVAGCTVLGGGGEDMPLFFSPWLYPGIGGDAVLAGDSASVDVRGSSDDLLRGGYTNYFSPASGVDGAAIQITSQATVAYSGVTLDGSVDALAALVAPPEPYLYARGDNAPGGL
ncbi:MAG TPA: hypothetical protein VJP77_08205, partial [Planctomycetota bacterium]|nr:hypothetical protein [Planctomycetota bacterium]